MRKEYKSDVFELTEDQSDEAWNYISEMQADIHEKSTCEMLGKIFKDKDLTLGQKMYIVYIFGRTEDANREFREIEADARQRKKKKRKKGE